MDCSPPGSSVHGISQARLLGWMVISFSRRSFTLVCVSRSVTSGYFETPWAVALQTPLSMGFSRQEYWSGLPLPSPGDLPNPGIESGSPTLQADSLPSEPPGFYHLSVFPAEFSVICRQGRSSSVCPAVYNVPSRGEGKEGRGKRRHFGEKEEHTQSTSGGEPCSSKNSEWFWMVPTFADDLSVIRRVLDFFL